MSGLHSENCVCSCQMSAALTGLKPLHGTLCDGWQHRLTRIMIVYALAASFFYVSKILEFRGPPLWPSASTDRIYWLVKNASSILILMREVELRSLRWQRFMFSNQWMAVYRRQSIQNGLKVRQWFFLAGISAFYVSRISTFLGWCF